MKNRYKSLEILVRMVNIQKEVRRSIEKNKRTNVSNTIFLLPEKSQSIEKNKRTNVSNTIFLLPEKSQSNTKTNTHIM